MQPATTENSTYFHTRSRHDALPISLPSASLMEGADDDHTSHHPCGSAGGGLRRIGEAGGLPEQRGRQPLRQDRIARPSRPAPAIRSEEHTSELQSLMRISYAVFCLKKKNKTTDT